MSRCEYLDICAFFTDDVGFSPDLKQHMIDTYCMGDNSQCARLLAVDVCGCVDCVSDDLLPSDHDRLEAMRRREDRACLENPRCQEDPCCRSGCSD